MEWYQYVAAFFSGAFFANVVPHFVKGICGDKFPTPFAKPPGKGLSSPLVNVVWALFNLVIGFLLFRPGQVGSGYLPILIVFFIGIAALSIMCSNNFQHKHKE
jgi:hypothetical protein